MISLLLVLKHNFLLKQIIIQKVLTKNICTDNINWYSNYSSDYHFLIFFPIEIHQRCLPSNQFTVSKFLAKLKNQENETKQTNNIY